MEYGSPDDLLCVITGAPISSDRSEFLEAHGITVIYCENGAFRTCGAKASETVGNLILPPR